MDAVTSLGKVQSHHVGDGGLVLDDHDESACGTTCSWEHDRTLLTARLVSVCEVFEFGQGSTRDPPGVALASAEIEAHMGLVAEQWLASSTGSRCQGGFSFIVGDDVEIRPDLIG